MHTFPPLVGGHLHGVFLQTINGCTTRSEPQISSGIVVRIAADLGDIIGELELCFAFGECLLSLPALCDIDDDADHPLCAHFVIVRNETASLDPPQFAAREKNAVIHTVLGPSLSECLAATFFQPHNILWVHSGQPLAARDLGGSLWKTVDCRIALRNL